MHLWFQWEDSNLNLSPEDFLRLHRSILIDAEDRAYEHLGRDYEDLIRVHCGKVHAMAYKMCHDYETLISEINEAFRPMYRKEP